MFGRKSKQQPEVPRDRRARTNAPPVNAAFSYYTSRPDPRSVSGMGSGARLGSINTRPEQRVRLLDQRGNTSEQPKAYPKILRQLPVALFALVALVCVGKLLLLGTDPKIIMLGKDDVSASYLKTNEDYQAAAQKALAGSITSHTKITVNLDGTASELRKQFPELQAVSVTLPLIGSRPIVYVQVAQPSVIVQSTHGNYALNKSGLVLSKVAALPSGVPLLVDQSGVMLQPGRQYLPGTTVSFIQTLAYQFAEAKIAVSAYVLPPGSPYELDVRLEGKPYMIRSSLVADALTQSGAAIATMQHLGSVVPGAYVDVRVPGRVYYK